jgi:hypothetical protein
VLYKTLSAAVYGIGANIVEVNISAIKTNEDHFHTVDLPDAVVRESRDRCAQNCPGGAEELRLRHSVYAHHHQPGSGRH